MKLFTGFLAAAFAQDTLPPTLTDILPNDLPADFGCSGSDRVVGGTVAADYWPFYVQIREKKNASSGGYGTCGGVIIHDRWVLTGKIK